MTWHKMARIAVVLGIAALIFWQLRVLPLLGDISWGLFLTLVVFLIIGFMFWLFERSQTNSKQLAVVATMAALAGMARVPFAAVMGLQPTTFLVMITGYVFGIQNGFVAGAAAALISNLFLGQGPWTPWQMLCWGGCGMIGGALARCQKSFNVYSLAFLGAVCGYVFGWVMDFWYWVAFVFPLTWKTFVAACAASFPSDTLHAVGNVVFSVVFGNSFYFVLNRFKTRFLVEYIE